MPYSYRRRPIGSCQPQQPLRASDTGRNVANAIALFERPIQVFVGPTPMRQGESEATPYPWPWVRMDTAAGVPTALDKASVWLRHPKGTFDLMMRLVGVTYVADADGTDPGDKPTFAPVLITTTLYQYQDGSDVPVQLAQSVTPTTIRCWPTSGLRLIKGTGGTRVYASPNSGRFYPLLLTLGYGWRAGRGLAEYDRNMQFENPGKSHFYPIDRAIMQPVRVALDYGNAGWSPDYATRQEHPCFIVVNCIKDPAREIVWDQSVIDGPLPYRSPEFIRIFNVGSQLTDRGRL